MGGSLDRHNSAAGSRHVVVGAAQTHFGRMPESHTVVVPSGHAAQPHVTQPLLSLATPLGQPIGVGQPKKGQAQLQVGHPF
jgi:hypothetical protein